MLYQFRKFHNLSFLLLIIVPNENTAYCTSKRENVYLAGNGLEGCAGEGFTVGPEREIKVWTSVGCQSRRGTFLEFSIAGAVDGY